MNAAKRRYRMTERARAADATRRKIIDAAAALFLEDDPDRITLDAIAARAGVTLQTVLRKFGSKDGVFAAAAELKSAEVVRAREIDRPGDHAAALRVLIDSYEQIGELSWRLLRFEATMGALHQILVTARSLHRGWIERHFADLLPRRGAARDRRIDALFTVTDFYVWKLHRVDLGRSRAETEAAMLLLIDSLARRFAGKKDA